MDWLVGDFGGTRARLALSRNGSAPERLRVYAADDFAAPAEVIRAYLNETDARPRAACLALAGPITGDIFRFTNRDWQLSRSALAHEFGFTPLLLLNDFEALALALPAFGPDDTRVLGEVISGAEGAPLVVLGPGTGLGVATLVPTGAGWLAVAGEGGHVSFAPQDDLEHAVAQALARRYRRVTNETLLSGPGLVALDSALAEIAGEAVVPRSAADVVAAALAGSDARAARALDVFCAVLGAVAGDVALITGARGGVYIGGGIAPRIADMLAASRFRARFEDKIPQQAYVAAIPTRLIVAAAPALLGAVAALKARAGHG